MANITLNAVKDTYINAKYPSNSYPTASVLKVGYPASGYGEYVSFIGFDLSSIPANKVITNLVFKVFFTSVFNEHFGSVWYPYYYPNSQFVMKARSLTDYSITDIDTLTHNAVSSKTGINNPYITPADVFDSSCQLTGSGGYYASFPVKSYSKSECIVAMFYDTNYSSTSGDNAFNFNSLEPGANVPVLEVTYVDYVPPKPTELIPNSSARNKAGDIKLSWKFEDTIMGTSQAAYELVYSTNNFSTSTTLTGTTNNYRTIPANTFTDGQTVSWKVRVTDSNGDTTEFSDVATFTIGATVPSAPELISPLNTIVNSSDSVIFRWKFTDLYGYSQAKYDLQYKKDGAAETTVSVTATANQYSMPINTLLGGNYSWRVRCYNAFNEVGPYSGWSTFYSIGKPNNPEIDSVSNNCRPVITWHATEQDLFRIKIYKNGSVIYDTDEQPGYAVNSYTVEDFLDDGNYIAGVSISNIYGFWSNETLYPFSLSTTKPAKPTIAGTANSSYAALIITSTASPNLIYRKNDDDFKLIAEITTNVYQDYAAPAGESQYFVRAVSETGFNDSDIFSLTIGFNGIVIADNENRSDFINLWQTRDSDKRRTISLGKEQYPRHYNGRTYPVLNSTEARDHSETYEYYIQKADYKKYYRIINSSTVLFKDSRGSSFVAMASNLPLKEDEFDNYIVGFTLTRLEE